MALATTDSRTVFDEEILNYSFVRCCMPPDQINLFEDRATTFFTAPALLLACRHPRDRYKSRYDWESRADLTAGFTFILDLLYDNTVPPPSSRHQLYCLRAFILEIDTSQDTIGNLASRSHCWVQFILDLLFDNTVPPPSSRHQLYCLRAVILEIDTSQDTIGNLASRSHSWVHFYLGLIVWQHRATTFFTAPALLLACRHPRDRYKSRYDWESREQISRLGSLLSWTYCMTTPRRHLLHGTSSIACVPSS
ncbi:hypothetical protein J6590_105622 [Homalodisca vitripennis]|nr:hypothetical protein J6590_105622 [Homalodisca vitripennis]